MRRKIKFYNLDAIISVGYRVNSKRGTQFRQWATQRLKDYLVQGYAINEKRLAQKQQEVEYLKTGIRILGRAIVEASEKPSEQVFSIFSKGLALLDDYDHEQLDPNGKTTRKAVFPSYEINFSVNDFILTDIEINDKGATNTQYVNEGFIGFSNQFENINRLYYYNENGDMVDQKQFLIYRSVDL